MRVFLLCCCLIAPLYTEDAVQAALQDQEARWYNTEQDALQRTDLEVRSDNDNDYSFIYDLMLALIYGIIVALIAYLIYLFVSNFFRHVDVGASINTNTVDKEHVKVIEVSDLPFQTNTNLDDVRSALDQAYSERNWSQVVIYALMLLLTEFHKSQLLHLRRGKTNRNYLKELRGASKSFQRILHLSVLLFERSFFGHHDIEIKQAQLLYSEVCKTHELLIDERREAQHE